MTPAWLIIILAASGWSSNSVYRSQFPDMAACRAAINVTVVDQPRGGDKNAVTVIRLCSEDPTLDVVKAYFSDTPPDKRGFGK